MKKNKKIVKSETVSLRLFPKDRLSLEIISSMRDQSLSKTIGDILTNHTKNLSIEGAPLDHLIQSIWDPFEPQCFINKTQLIPNHLTYLESAIFSKVKRMPQLWIDDKIDVTKLAAIWSMLKSYYSGSDMLEDEAAFDAEYAEWLKLPKVEVAL